MKEVVLLKIKYSEKLVYCSPGKVKLKSNDKVICKTQNGLEYAQVVSPLLSLDEKKVPSTLQSVVRVATPKDTAIFNLFEKEQDDAFPIVEEAIAKNKLNINLVRIYRTFDGNKMIFYFSADERVDFRALVKDLAEKFHRKIEMRQIGVRDESRILGGLGICGRPLCCSKFLKNFNPVSMKMAKEQGISLNPTKLAGSCSRLMCCLKYEQEAYNEILRTSPVIGSTVVTSDGEGIILDGNPLKGIYRIRLKSNPDAAPKHYDKKDFKFVPACSNKQDDKQKLKSAKTIKKPIKNNDKIKDFNKQQNVDKKINKRNKQNK